MADPALQLPPKEDNEIDISDQIRQRDGGNAIDISDQIRKRDGIPGPEEVPDDQSGAEQSGVVDRAQDLKDQFGQGKELYGKGKEKLAKAGAKKAGKEGLKEGVEKRGVAAAEAGAKKLAGTGAKTAATSGAKLAGKAALLEAEALTGPAGWLAGAVTILSSIKDLLPLIKDFLLPKIKQYGQYAIYAVATLLLLLAVPFGLLGGKGVDIKPTTAAEKNQAVVAAALAGNLVAGRQVTQKSADEIKTHYKDLVKLAKPEKKAEVEKRTNEIAVLLDQLVSLSGDPQKKLLAQIKEKEKSLMDKYSELFAETGTCADLAPFIASGQFRVGSGPNAKNIILGKMAIKASGKTEPASQGLCKMLVLALKSGYKIHTDTLSYGHPILTKKHGKSGGNRSDHTCGAAIDINYINADASGTFDRKKHHSDNNNPDVGKLAKLWYDAGLAGTIYVKQMIVPSAFKQFGMMDNQPKTNYRRALQDDHENHIHLAGQLEPGACQ